MTCVARVVRYTSNCVWLRLNNTSKYHSNMARTLSALQVLSISNETIKLSGGWAEAFGDIDRYGIVFIYGPSTGGKSSAALCFAKELTRFGRVLYVSNEEGFATSFQNRMRRFCVSDCGSKFQFTSNEAMSELIERLKKRKSADFVVIDSVQDSQISRAEYRELKRLSTSKMLIFVSRVEGSRPMGRLAVDIKFDAGLKVWVEGGRAKSEGRYIGSVGHFDVIQSKAREYWGPESEKEE